MESLYEQCIKLGIKNYLRRNDSFLEKAVKVAKLMDQYQQSSDFENYSKVEIILGEEDRMSLDMVKEEQLDQILVLKSGSVLKSISSDEATQITSLFHEGKSNGEIAKIVGCNYDKVYNLRKKLGL